MLLVSNENKFIILIKELRSLTREVWVSSILLSIAALLVHNSINFPNLILPLGIGLGYILAFSLNDYYDRSYDANSTEKSKRNFFVRHENINQLAFAGVVIISLLILIFIFGQFGYLGIIWLIFSVVILWAYSAPPIRFKSLPIFDLFVPMLFMHSYPYYLTVELNKFEWNITDFVIIGILALLSLSSQLEQQIRDYEVDSQVDNNFTVMVGKQISIRFMQVTTIFASILFLYASFAKIIPFELIPISCFYILNIFYRFLSPQEGKNEIISRIGQFIATIYFIVIIIWKISLH